MTRDEHRQAVARLLAMVAPDNQANASELLTTLSEDYEATLTTSETQATRVSELTANVENLRRVNTELFLKVGTKLNSKDTKTPEEESNIPKIEIASLFDEKGELK